jgi:hypothetical protein
VEEVAEKGEMLNHFTPGLLVDVSLFAHLKQRLFLNKKDLRTVRIALVLHGAIINSTSQKCEAQRFLVADVFSKSI